MEIKNLQTFIKIVEFNNFTRAAESLGYSQAAVTAQIKALESELGVLLFDRIGKKIYLTHEGETFLPHAKKIINAEAEALESVRPEGELTGELIICSASSYASRVLPDILLEYRSLHPGVTITVKVSDFVEDNIQKLARGEIDFLAELDEDKSYQNFNTVYKQPIPLVFVTHVDNPLAKKKKVSVAEAVADEFIVSDREIGYCMLLERELGKRGIELKPAMEIGSVDAILNVIARGFGTAIMPEYMAKDMLDTGEIAKLNVNDIEIGLMAHIICSKDRWMDPLMKEFIRIISDRG